MHSYKLAAPALAIFVALSMALAACGGGSSAPGAAQDYILSDASGVSVIEVQAILNAAEVPAMIAEGGDLGIVNVSADSDEDFADALTDAWEDIDATLGTSLDEVSHIVETNSYTIIKGSFDFAGIRNELEDQDYDDGTYREFELWEAGSTGVALFEGSGIFVRGNVETIKEVIKAIARGDGFLSAEDDLKRALDRAGSGMVTAASTGCQIDANGCNAVVRVITGGDEDRTELTTVYLFSSDRRAESGMDDIEDSILDNEFIDVDIEEITASGEFVTLKTVWYE